MEGMGGSGDTSLEATAEGLTKDEEAQTSVMVSFMCQFGGAVGPRYVVKHYPGYFFEGTF